MTYAEIVCDSKKVSDHHAIITTKSMPQADLSELPSGEKAILQLIAVRLLCSVADPYRYAEDSLVMTCGGEEFTKKSRTVLDGGWKEIWQQFYPAKEKEKDEYHGPDLSPDTTVSCSGVSMKTGQTSPPKRFTEDTLLNSMETAGAEEIPDDAERKGLGTPATRAGIIEKLVQKGFIERKGDKKTRYLVSTDKGNSLITVMPEQIQSASMTADWEQKLLLIEHGQYDAGAFMKEINEMISSLVSGYEAVKGAKFLISDHQVIGRCPHCGGEVIERQKSWSCSNRDCKFALWKDNAFFRSIGKTFTASMAEKLLKDGRIRLRNCESRKTGKTYDADLVLLVGDDGTAQFRLDFGGVERRFGKEKK